MIVGSVAAFVAPPFTGLDTLPSLGVVVLSLGVLLKDILVVAAALVIAAAGIILEIVLGRSGDPHRRETPLGLYRHRPRRPWYGRVVLCVNRAATSNGS